MHTRTLSSALRTPQPATPTMATPFARAPALVRTTSARSVPVVVVSHTWTIAGLPPDLASYPEGKCLKSSPFIVDTGDGLPPFYCFLEATLNQTVAAGTTAAPFNYVSLTLRTDLSSVRPLGRSIETDVVVCVGKKDSWPLNRFDRLRHVDLANRGNSSGRGVNCPHETLKSRGLPEGGKLDVFCEIAVRQETISGDAEVEEEEEVEEAHAAVTTPAHKALADDLGGMLDSGGGADVWFTVGGVTMRQGLAQFRFSAHTFQLKYKTA